MSHLSKVFTDVPIEVQDRSGFDLSHENLFTATVGTLTPCLVEEVLPGDIFNIGVWFQTKTPPLATPFYGRVDAKVEVFACANSVLWQGWKQFIQQRPGYGNTLGVGTLNIATTVPQCQVFDANTKNVNTLADYLGFRDASNSAGATYLNALPFIMYHKIVDDYYRNSLITKPMFNESYGSPSNPNADSALCNVLWTAGNVQIGSGKTGNNGYRLNDLRQRCWAKDAFTTATLKPQFSNDGAAAYVSQSTDGNEDDIITIADFRAANALQKFLERSNCSTKYDDFVMAHYGVFPSDAIMDKPMFLGQVSVPVYVNSVASTTNDVNSNGNRFTTNVGGEAGKIVSVGDGNICSNFKCNWHGYIMGIYSLVPHAYYGTGVRKYLTRTLAGDFAFPEFAGIGDEAILKREITLANVGANDIFGYNRRYYSYLYHDDEVHGKFSYAEDLNRFVLQRAFSGDTTLSTAFMEIPKTAMDWVQATSADLVGFNAMVDMYWTIKVLRRLPESPLPHL